MNNFRQLDLNLLLTLEALLEEGHVSRAALRVNRSQPAVSHALAELRRVFCDPLLVRRGGGMVLSARAMALRDPLRQVLIAVRELLTPAELAPENLNRRFRLAMSDYGAQVILPPLLCQLRRKAPKVQLAISQGSRDAMLMQLMDGEVDIALGVFPTPPVGIEVESLFEERFVCVSDARQVPVEGLTLKEWLQRPHVVVTMHPEVPSEVDLALKASGINRDIAVSLPHWSAATALLPQTDLVLTVARRAVNDAEDLRVFEPPFPIQVIEFQQAWHVRRERDLELAWLRSQLKNAIQS